MQGRRGGQGHTGQVGSVGRGREKKVKTAKKPNARGREDSKLWIYRGTKEWETTATT